MRTLNLDFWEEGEISRYCGIRKKGAPLTSNPPSFLISRASARKFWENRAGNSIFLLQAPRPDRHLRRWLRTVGLGKLLARRVAAGES